MPMMFACCAGDDGLEGKAEALPGGLPVLFSSGAGDASVSTRATVPYMENDGRFVCRMYYQGNVGSKDFTNYTEAWLKVDNNYGNSVYRKKDFSEPTEENKDGFGFDRESQIFYWQNRKKHIFIAIADYNKLKTNDGTDNGTLNFKNSEEIEGKPMVFDLRRKDGMNSISDQQDIIMAHTEMSPDKATPEGNRVKLLFEHCFAKVQVNLKPSSDGGLGKDLTWKSIEKVELLGVADYAYLYNIDVTSSQYNINNVKTEAKKVVANDYLNVNISDNPYYHPRGDYIRTGGGNTSDLARNRRQRQYNCHSRGDQESGKRRRATTAIRSVAYIQSRNATWNTRYHQCRDPAMDGWGDIYHGWQNN